MDINRHFILPPLSGSYHLSWLFSLEMKNDLPMRHLMKADTVMAFLHTNCDPPNIRPWLLFLYS